MIRDLKDLSRQGDNRRVTRSMAKVNPSIGPNIGEIVNFAMVGGTDDLHDNHTSFNDAWDNTNEEEKTNWRKAIKKIRRNDKP